jgi:uncharacterized protein YukE
MLANTAMLHSGAGESYRAAEHAQDGATHLSLAASVAGMFGKFDTADDFHDAVTAAHAYHVKTLQSHQHNLDDLGANVHHIASSFSAMDASNAKMMREV